MILFLGSGQKQIFNFISLDVSGAFGSFPQFTALIVSTNQNTAGDFSNQTEI